MITVLVISILILVAIAGLLYFFKPKPKPKNDDEDGDKKPKIPQFAKDWWKNMHESEHKKQMFWLIVTLLLAYLAFVIFKGENAAAARAIVVLLGFHLVWWLLSTGKGWLTPLFVYGIGAYLVLAWLLPDDTSTMRKASLGLLEKGYGSIANTLKSADENYGKAEVSQSAENVNVDPPAVSVIVPTDATIEVDRPVGHYLLAVNCPQEIVMEVIDMSTGALLRQEDCAIPVKNGNMPMNIRLAFFQKEGGRGPVDVLVWWKKIS